MRLVAITAMVTFLLDQASKWIVVWGMNLYEKGVIEVWSPFLTFRMAWNTGVNFGLFAHSADAMRWVLVAIALVISAWVWLWMRREGASVPARISAGLLIGGALGNVIDRIVYGAVADFLNISCCGIENPYAFNVADITVFAGAVGLVLFTGGKPKNSPPSRPTSRDKTS